MYEENLVVVYNQVEKRNVIISFLLFQLYRRQSQYAEFMDKVSKTFLHLEHVQWGAKMKYIQNGNDIYF